MPQGAPISRVKTWLARGGQPVRDEYAELYSSGIRLVVNLRLHHDDATEIERHAPGLTSVRIPVVNDQAPSEAQAVKWLALCDSLDGRLPIYVHCHEGHGRTSVFCGLVRIAQGWDLERIFAEEQKYGFDPKKQEEQTAFIRRFYEEFKAGRREMPALGTHDVPSR